MPSPSDDDANFLTAYGIIRGYVEDENRLTSERISRTLLVHGFLIASFVILVQAKVQMPDGAKPDDLLKVLLKFTLPMIGVMGIITSVAALIGVSAASWAIDALDKRAELLKSSQTERWNKFSVPDATGGGSLRAKSWGRRSATGLLWSLLLFWFVISLLTLSPDWLSRFT